MSMRIDLTSPVEAWKTTLPTPDKPECEVTLFNLSSLQVVSVEVTLLLSSADGEETAKIIHRGRGLNGAPGRTFHMTVPVEGHITPERYEITVEKVWFDNASVWRHEKDNTLVYEPNNLHRSAQLTTLRSVAGDMASGYPVQHRAYWVCVCGRPNLNDAFVCARCHREKNEVFRSFSKEAIDAVVAQREAALAEHGRETLRETSRKFADEKDFVRRKGRHAWVWKLAVAVVVIAGLAFAGYEYGVPYVQYELAKKEYEAGAYEQAAQQFAALGDYKDADAMVRQCQVNQAQQLVGAATEEEVLQARALYAGLNDAQNVAHCDWLRAEIMFSEGRYDEAEPLYLSLGEQYEAPARLTEIAYIRACGLLENAEWESARTAFADLGGYKDSASLYLDTWYNPAVKAMDIDDTETALTLLGEIPGHRDADMLVKKIHYDRGVYLRSEGRINEAAEAFHLARGYEDAEAQANECFYGPASIAWETMDYEKAAALFAKIPGYRDADEKQRASVIESAKIAIAQIDYKKALQILETLPAEDADAAALIAECTYQPAVNAYVRGDYAEAITLFTAVADYKDSAEQIKKSQYALAGQMETSQPEKAAELYAALGDYSDAAEKLTAVRYAQAEAALAAGDATGIDQAITILKGMTDHPDAPARLADATFAKAEILLQQGDHAAARALIADYAADARAANVFTACDYAAALALAEAGKTNEALAAFEALGDYADAADKAALMRYEAALALSKPAPAKASELLEAMGDYADAAINALELRYQQAEALISTDREAAIAAFRALNYADATDRANQLCYEDAEALLRADRPAAIAAFEALGAYADAAERVNALRYEDASALSDAGAWEAAAAAFKGLTGYSNAAARADALYHDAGLAFAEKGEWDKAAAAFEAMSGETDADETVSQLRYDAAEELLASGNADTAAAAFEALGDFLDAADRARQIRYEAAEKLALTDWEAGAAAFDKLAGYADAADRANALRYNAAAKVALEGDWRTAAAMYEALGAYSDSADKALQVRYQAAAQMVAKQQWDDAIALYTELGSYADCAERIPMTRYAQAQSVENAGEYLAAARLYKALGGYKDAAAKVTAMQDAYYAGPAEAMSKAGKAEKWQDVLNIMSWLDVTELPNKYDYLHDLYHKACYNEGNRLYNEGKPYEAWMYYKELPANYGNMKDRLQKPCYLILGTWEDLQGNRYIFRGEGVCSLNGEALCFNMQDATLFTGKTADSLAATHRITGVNRTHAWLYDQRGEKEITIYLTRVTE